MKHRVQFLGRRPCLPDLTPAGLRNVDHELPESLGMTLDCLFLSASPHELLCICKLSE
jgi:hypothetical protein